MSPRTGRPTDSPKNTMVRVRMDDESIRMLDECTNILKISRSEIIRSGIKKVYSEIKK